MPSASPKRYDWSRLWIPRGEQISTDRDGFPIDPLAPSIWQSSDSKAVRGDSLRKVPCIVLLGESGMGKSHALEDALNDSKLETSHGHHVNKNLGDYSSEDRLLRELFETDQFRKWSSEGLPFYLFLDNFDKCLPRIDSVAGALASFLDSLPHVENFYLRIVSRPSEWPPILEERLKRTWRDHGGVTVCELVPLTREQISSAARDHGIDPEAFLKAVVEREIVSFASKPVTLEFLFGIWKKEKTLPKSQDEIYERGCELLCNEINPECQTPLLRPTLSAPKRLNIASRIAAASVFGKRPLIDLGNGVNDFSSECLQISELEGNDILIGQQTAEIHSEMVRETLKTGLFSPRDPKTLRWMHPTIADYLAARYLWKHSLSDEQLTDLLLDGSDKKRRIVPQLREVAALVAFKNASILEKLVLDEPEVLLRGDIVSAKDDVKARIVETLLKNISRVNHNYDWGTLHRRYPKLMFPGIAGLLKTILNDDASSDASLQETARFCGICEVKEVYPDILRLALDGQKDIRLRSIATQIISESGEESLVKELVPLALNGVRGDTYNRLRGAALAVCWSKFISAEQLFTSLVYPNQEISEYSQFLRYHLVEGLTINDLPAALTWIMGLPQRRGYPHDQYFQLVSHILQMAIPLLGDPHFLQLFAKALLARSRCHDGARGISTEALTKALSDSPDLRHRIVEAMIDLAKDPEKDAWLVIGRSGFRLLGYDDLRWVLTKLEAESDLKKQTLLSWIVNYLFRPVDTVAIDRVFTLKDRLPIFEQIMSAWVRPVNLQSVEAQKARELVADQLAIERTQLETEAKIISPTPAERVEQCLIAAEGNPAAFGNAVFWLGIDATGLYTGTWWSMDVRTLEGWTKMDSLLLGRLCSSARQYLENYHVAREQWADRVGQIYFPALAGGRAAALLSAEDPEAFGSLSRELWLEWFPVMLRYHDTASPSLFLPLLDRAKELLGDTAVAMILEQVNHELKTDGHLFMLNKLHEPLDAKLGQGLLDLLHTGIQNSVPFQRLLGYLAGKVPGVVDFARELIDSEKSEDADAQQRCAWAAYILLKHGQERDWPSIWKLIEPDSSFGQRLCSIIHEGEFPDFRGMLKILNISALGQFWEWLIAQYPIASDPDRGRGGTVDVRWGVATLRDSIISRITDFGTVAALNELQRFHALHPTLDLLKRELVRGEELMRHNSWQPRSSADIFSLCENRRLRFVNSEEQLAQVLVTTLNELQKKLQGETPMAPSLWNGHKPKDEEALSDWLKVELQERLRDRQIILGREVQVNRKDRTDIHVDAITDGGSGEKRIIKVIIEVKGCWHPDLKIALITQLVDKYLGTDDCRTGIYLVGWYNCLLWDETDDDRRHACSFSTQEDLFRFLEAQSRNLGKDEQVLPYVLDISLRGKLKVVKVKTVKKSSADMKNKAKSSNQRSKMPKGSKAPGRSRSLKR